MSCSELHQYPAACGGVFYSPDVRGRFILRAGVGENGIPLSPDSLIIPYTGEITPDLVTAAVGLLGQAWSVATAPSGALPATVLPISKTVVSSRAYDLSEAGLRVLVGDSLLRAAQDLTFDYLGSDVYNKGFDSLRRSSTMGLEFNRALAAIFRTGLDNEGAIAFQAAFSDKVSYRPAHLSIIAGDAPLRLRLSDAAGNRTGSLDASASGREIAYADSFGIGESGASRAAMILATRLDATSYTLELASEGAVSSDLGIVMPDAGGVLNQYVFSTLSLPAGARGRLEIVPGSGVLSLLIDDNSDGTIDRTLFPTTVTPIPDHAPHIVAAAQLVPDFGPGGDKHGRNVALLFSERVTKESAHNAANYAVDENEIRQVTLQPGGRMAFLLLRDGIGPFFDRGLTAQGLTDPAGRTTAAAETLPIRITATGPAAVVTGTVRTSRGEPVPNATVRLYQLIWYKDPLTQIPEERYALFTEKQGNGDGSYRLEYVLQNDPTGVDPSGPFKIEVVNPAGGEVGSLTTGVMFHGQRLNLDIFMKARGSLSGVVRNESGTPVGGATVQVITLADNRGQRMTSDASGAFSFNSLMVGAYSLTAVHQASLSQGNTMGTLPEEGSAVTQDVTIRRVADTSSGTVSGKVLNSDGTTPRPGVVVIVEAPNYRNWQRSAVDGGFGFSGVYAGTVKITARDDVSGEQSEVGGTLTNGATLALSVIMRGTGSVAGVVRRDDGKSPEGLYVIVTPSQGQPRVVHSDGTGAFKVDGLPIGTTKVDILDPRDFNRTVASGSVTILAAGDVADIALFVPLRALASGTIQGVVRHRDGTPWANAPIKRIVNAFQYYQLQADAAGGFTIPALSLGNYQLSVVSGNEVINVSTDLWYDTQVRTLELTPVGLGTITGTTWDDAEKTLPTGSDVTLYSMKPNLVGWLRYDTDNPTMVKSDPQSGRFSFNGVLEGSFTVTSSNIFRPTPVSAGGRIEAHGQVVNLDLALKGTPPQPGDPPPVNQPGSVSGRVLMPNGSPAGKDVRVTVTFGGADVTVTTDEQGLFRFAPLIPSGSQPIVAEDPATTLKWKGNVYVPSGLDVPITIKLLGRGGLTVRVLNADGTPAAGAMVNAAGSAYPNDSASGTSDQEGMVSFTNLSEGSYAVSATGSFGRGGRNEAFIPGDKASVTAEVRLAPSTTVIGRFLKADGVTPIPGGQIALRRNGQTIAYASSSSDGVDPGRFRMEYVPLGDFSVEGYDPVTERRGVGGGRLSADGETVTADVVVTPRGSVKGLVLNHGGSAPIAGAPVSISVSGVTGFNFSSVTAPDGGFFFSGVPAGRYTLDATDLSNGLRGQASGTLSYENETVTAQVHIAPTGSIAGRVLMPDGVTPVLTATVRLDGGTPQPVDQVSGEFRYDNLAAGRSYTLASAQPNTRRSGSTIATISRDLETANGDIILGGIGTVSGLVFDSDGTTPLGGAKVDLRFGAATLTDYTADSGSFGFGDIPTGAFTLTASHAQRTTGASRNGYLQSEGEAATVSLVLGPVASVKATVLLADGVTPSRGGGIRLSTSTGSLLTGITDSSGQYTFEAIPVPCTVSLYVEDAAGVGIGRAYGVLDQNGQVLDLGVIVLDDRPIFVTSVNPAPGAVSVPIDQQMRVLFSEPADLTTLTSSNIYLMQGTSRVDGALEIDAGNSSVTFRPSLPLKGFALYTLVVSDGVTDRVGRRLALAQSVSFTTVDNIPPALGSISPADGALQVAGDAVIRLTFSEALDATSINGITLTMGGAAVPARLDLLQGGTVAALTPLEPLAFNRTYLVTVIGVKDTVGNILAGTQQFSFSTIDTIPPAVMALTVPPTSDLIKGNSVPVTATVADTDVAFVDFYLNEEPVGSVNQPPYTLAVTLAKEGQAHLKAIAQDRVGNRGAATPLDISVAADQPPQVSFVDPAEGSGVNTGATFTVRLQGSDDLGIGEFTLAVSGEMTNGQTRAVTATKSAGAEFTLTAPTGITKGGTIILTATASDTAGASSQPVQRTVVLRDGIAPTISLGSPGQTVQYRPGETAAVAITGGDNVGVTRIYCTAAGAATATQGFDLSPAETSANRSFSFGVPAGALPHAVITAACTAYDAAGNNTSATLDLSVADVVAPLVSGASVTENAADVPTNASISVSFNETLATASVTATTVTLTESATGTVVPASVTLSADSKSVTLKPIALLSRGVGYTLTVTNSLSDEAGNTLAFPYLLRFSCDSAAPVVESVTPVAGSVNIPVGSVVSVRFGEQIDPVSVTTDLVLLSSISGAVPGSLSVSADGLALTFKPYNQLGFARAYTFTLKAGVRDISGNATTNDLIVSFNTRGADSDLVGYWPMDGDWTDYSGNGNHGTVYGGAAFSSDKVVGTQTGSFDGVDDCIKISSPAGGSLNPLNAVSIEAWVYWQGPGRGSSYIISKGWADVYEMLITSDGKVAFRVVNNYNAGILATVTSKTSLETNKWYYVAGTYDKNIGYAKIYVNGHYENFVAFNNTMSQSSYNVKIGSNYQGGEDSNTNYWQMFKGLIDEVAIYKRALLEEDIFEHYNAGLTSDRTPPAAPTVEPVASPTFRNQVALRGTKEAGSSIRVNGRQIVAHDANTTWQVLYQLSLGQNLLDVSSHDPAGNISPSVNLVVDLLPMDQNDPTIAGMWHFDGDWKDYSGNGNDGTPNNGVTFSSDKYFGVSSASFDGSDDYVSGLMNNFPIGGVARTEMAWIKTSDQNGDKSIIHYGAANGSSPPQNYHLAITNGKAAIGNGYGYGVVVGTASLADGAWHLITGVYEGASTNLARIYVDGVQQNFGVITTPATANQSFMMGRFMAGGGQLNAVIDEVAVYKRALSSQEILNFYNASPKLILTSPGQTVKYKPGEAGIATVTATNPNGIAKLYCNASGAAGEGTLVVPFDPPQTDVTQQLTFRVASDAASYAPYRLSCIAETVAGTFGTSNLDLQAADLVPATVTGVSIADGATGVIATLPINVTFNEAVQAASLTSDTVKLRRVDTGVVVAGTSVLSTDGKTLTFTPAAALECFTAYQFVIHGVNDLAGNSSDYSINFSTQPLTSPLIENKGTSASPYILATGRYGIVTVQNSFVVLDGLVAADSMTVSSNSTITHKATGLSGTERLNLVVTGELNVDASSKIDVSGKGYLGGWQGGNNTNVGRTLANTNNGASVQYTGGSYGGIGGDSAWNGGAGASYGSLQLPLDAGSGGGADGGGRPGGNGGGSIKITTGSLSLFGSIVADGGNTSASGAGSGGSILINAGLLSGNGWIYARGGSTGYCSNGSWTYGSGGGGRIAVYYDVNTLPVGNLLASGGKTCDGSIASRNGGAGTIYLKDSTKHLADLIVDNKGTGSRSGSTPLISLGRGTVSIITYNSLSMNGANWMPEAFIGNIINPEVAQDKYFVIRDNNTDTIFIDPAEGYLNQFANVGSTFSGVFEFDNVSVSGKAKLLCEEELRVHSQLSIDDATVSASDFRGGQTLITNNGVLSR